MNVKMNSKICMVLVSAVVLSACGGSDSSTRTDGQAAANPLVSATVEIRIPFAANAGAQTLDCDTMISGLGLSGSDARLAAFALYIHDVALVTDQGALIPVVLQESHWQQQGVALIDFQNRLDFCSGERRPVNTELFATVDAEHLEHVRSVRFTVGVPADLNHEDAVAASAPLNNTQMWWNWQGGYKFMRLDVEPVGGVARPGSAEWSSARWNFHLGSTNCMPDPRLPDREGSVVECAQPNRVIITLDNFDLDSTVVVDYAQLVAQANLGVDEDGAAGCMSGFADPECGALFAALGIVWGGDPAAEPREQTVFRLERD